MGNYLKVFLVLVVAFGNVLIANDLCEVALQKVADGKFDKKNIVSWRSEFTAQSDKPVSSLKSNKTRENEIHETMTDMIETIVKENATPAMELIPEVGARIEELGEWEKDAPYRVEVKGSAVKNGILKATLLLPVSGHTGIDNARKWSTTDTYSVFYEDASGNKVTLAKDVLSKALITAQELEIPLEKGKTVKISYVRSGSLGPSGYTGGRVMEITWK